MKTFKKRKIEEKKEVKSGLYQFKARFAQLNTHNEHILTTL